MEPLASVTVQVPVSPSVEAIVTVRVSWTVGSTAIEPDGSIVNAVELNGVPRVIVTSPLLAVAW